MPTEERIKERVRKQYGEIATRFVSAGSQAGCCGAEVKASSCCEAEQSVADQTDADECCADGPGLYSLEEVADLPDTVTGASLGSGNPTALAGLQPGESVLDLGSGGGIDCFLAAKQVGPEGNVVGLDMTPEMIKLARQNAREIGLPNVDFRFGEMEDMPIADESVDVIISNCVINLSPDKDAVFAEAYRVLKPGGRLAVSDMVTHGPLPDAVTQSSESWACCVAGALDVDDYLAKLRAAGFAEVQIVGEDPVDTDAVADALDADGQLDLGESESADQLRLAMRNRVASISIVARKS